jgi:hypothetical protein
MKLDGSLSDNLRAAVRSAKRLRGHHVHRDTLEFWRNLLSHARTAARNPPIERSDEIDALIAELQGELIAHEQHG